MKTETYQLLQVGMINGTEIQARFTKMQEGSNPLVTIPASHLFLAVGPTNTEGDLLVVAQFAHTLVSRETKVHQISCLDNRVVLADGIDVSDVSIAAGRLEETPIYVVAPGYETGFDLFAGVTVLRTSSHPREVYVAYYVCTRNVLPAVRKRGVPR